MQYTVKITFEFGVLLPDPDKVLEGSGKQVRYLSLRVAEKIPQEALRELVLAALALPPGR